MAELHALALRGVSRTKLPFEQPDCENSDRWKLGLAHTGRGLDSFLLSSRKLLTAVGKPPPPTANWRTRCLDLGLRYRI